MLAATVAAAVVAEPDRRAAVLVVGVVALLAVRATARVLTCEDRAIHHGPRVLLAIVLPLIAVQVAISSDGPVVGMPSPGVLDAVLSATGLFAVLVISEAWMLRTRPQYAGKVCDQGTGLLIGACTVVAFGGSVAAAVVGFGPVVSPVRWPLLVVGVGLGVGGVLLRGWAIVSLGPLFQPRLVVQRDHVVVTRGPFRLVRHPSYTGPILLFAGIGLVLDNWVALVVCVVVPVAGYVRRIAVEERMLTAGLGRDYERYREHTDRLVPGVW